MTDVELLPLYAELQGHPKLEIIKHYAHANVARAIAAKGAEIEALRAEVEMLRDAFSDEDMTAGAHWFGRYVEQKRRAEQLAEALRELRNHTSVNSDQIALIDAALEQENDDA